MATPAGNPVGIRWHREDLEVIRKASRTLGIPFSRFLRVAAAEHLQRVAAEFGQSELKALAEEHRRIRRHCLS